jgi:hypothetical protein
LQNFSKINQIWPYPFQSNKPNHTHDHKAITKLKISETRQETTKSIQLCKKPAQINNQSRKIISNFKSNPEPMTLSQITNTKILSFNTSKLKQFLSLKDEQLNKSSQWNNLKEKMSKKTLKNLQE